MMRNPVIAGVFSLLILGLAGAAFAEAFTPGISKEKAEKIALESLGVKVLATDLEKEHGKWRYTVDVEKDKVVMDIEVDATTGEILSSKKDD